MQKNTINDENRTKWITMIWITDTMVLHVREADLSNNVKHSCFWISFVDDTEDRDPYSNPSDIDNNGQTPTIFYCHQEDFHLTLIRGTLDDEGFGKCNISNRVVLCPIEIECRTDEADECCEGNDDFLSSWWKYACIQMSMEHRFAAVTLLPKKRSRIEEKLQALPRMPVPKLI